MQTVFSAVTFIGSILFLPFLTLLLCIIFLASIGKSLGVRRLYVKILLRIFEYGRVNIESARRTRKLIEDSDDDEGYVEGGAGQDKQKKAPKQASNGLKNGYIPNGNSLITRDVVLVPEPAAVNNHEDGASSDEETKLLETKEKYDLSKVFDYIKAGTEAIIEDQVTSRFEAEELKNWNLLIRTNRQYEFISLKLTILWMIGFFMRYFFLFPLRVMICCFGVGWLMMTTPLIGLLPTSSVKRWVNHRAYIIAFRMLARSFTGRIRIHNRQYRPQRGTVCVANHTSPIDVVILSTDMSYSLVSPGRTTSTTASRSRIMGCIIKYVFSLNLIVLLEYYRL